VEKFLDKKILGVFSCMRMGIGNLPSSVIMPLKGFQDLYLSIPMAILWTPM